MARVARRFASPSGPLMGFLYSEAVDAGAVGAASTLDLDVAVPDALVGDVVTVTMRTALAAGLSLGGARVKAAGTVTIRFVNSTAAPIDPAANTADIYLQR